MFKQFLLIVVILGAVSAQENQCNDSCDPLNRCDLNITTGFYQCINGTFPYNNSCYLCDLPGCNQCYGDNFCIDFNDTICQSDQSVDIFGQNCISCNVSNCKRCDRADHCAICDFDYLQDNGSCTAVERNPYRCPLWCNACLRRGRFSLYCPTCTQIYQKPTPNQKECVICALTNCLHCSELNNCMICQRGFKRQEYQSSCNCQSDSSDSSSKTSKHRNRDLRHFSKANKKFRCVPIRY